MNAIENQAMGRTAKYVSLALLWSAFLLFLVSMYNGNSHGMYLNVYQAVLDPLRFSKDVYLKNTFFFDITIVDDVMRLLGVSFFDNDIIGVFVYLVVCLASFWAINALLKDYFGVDEVYLRLLLFLMVAFFGYDKFLEYSEARFIYPHTGTPSFLAYQLKYVFLLLLLRGQLLAGGGFLCLLWAISFNHSWYLIVLAFGFHFFKGDWKTPRMAVYALPIAYILWRRFGMTVVGDPVELISIATRMVREEDLIHLNQWINLAVFSASFIIWPFLCRSVTNLRLTPFLRALFWSTLGLFVFGYIYGRWGWMYFPVLGLTSLCFIKVMGLYISFFYILLMLAVIRSDKLLWLEKAMLLVLVAFWTMTTPASDFTRYFKGAFILVFFWFLAKQFGALKGAFSKRMQDAFGPGSMAVALSVFMLATSIYYLRGAYPRWIVNWDARMASFEATGKWTLRGTPSVEMVKTLVALRDESEDVVIIPLESAASGRLEPVLDASFLALKTTFMGSNVHAYMNKPLYDEHCQRRALLESLLSDLNAERPVNEGTLVGLTEREVHILLPDTYSQYISSQSVRRMNGFSMMKVGLGG